ncbi:DegT/DnrJ/EryC1/StrS family aminotransferase [Pelagibacterales bacterium SAG-MED32]|nr:DegT/DnrJ/EryC1/StrS family aminotransferase [Pelagibacterales bacterium SAG-MED32]
MDPKWTKGNELKYLKQILENSDEARKQSFTDKLESEFKKKYGVKYAIALNSGASGLHAAMHAVGVEPGDEVITSPFSVLWDASIAIIMGAKVKFADIKYGTHNIDPEKIEEQITEKTKAIIPVSYHGLPCDIDEIVAIGKKHNIPVIEDNAQTMLGSYKGRYVGTDTDIAMFSFERTKHITCHEGGILLTNNEDLAEKARKFAGGGFKNLTSDKSKLAAIIPEEFQSPDFIRHDALGLNYRIPEFCAAVALAQFEMVEEKVKIRRDIAKLYDEVFSDYNSFSPQEVPEGYGHSYFTYSVKSPFSKLAEWKSFYKSHVSNGGDTFYAMMATVYNEGIMRELGYSDEFHGKCPITEEVQPTCMLFKTNYRSIEEAEKNISVLKDSLKKFL